MWHQDFWCLLEQKFKFKYFLILLLVGSLHVQTSNLTAERIISLAPSITEIMIALGVEDLIVGATKYCSKLGLSNSVSIVGSHQDIQLETLIQLKPDYIFALNTHLELKEKLESFGIKIHIFDHRSLNHIQSSIYEIGQICHQEERALKLLDQIQININDIQNLHLNKKKPNIIIVINRDYTSSSIRDFYIAGDDQFYSPMIEYAGAHNAYHGTVAYPLINLESLVWLNPDIIIEIIPEQIQINQKWIHDWKTFFLKQPKVPKIYLLHEDYLNRPGPFFYKIIKKISDLVLEDPVEVISD